MRAEKEIYWVDKERHWEMKWLRVENPLHSVWTQHLRVSETYSVFIYIWEYLPLTFFSFQHFFTSVIKSCGWWLILKMGQNNGRCYLGERISFTWRCQYPQKTLFQSVRGDLNLFLERFQWFLDPTGSAVFVVKSSWQKT